MGNSGGSAILSHVIQRAKAKLLTSFGLERKAGAHLKVYPSDVFIVSYPRSGNTWMRFLVGGLAFQEDVDFRNMEEYVPDIYRCTHSYLESLGRPRYLKSHEPYDARYSKVIYMVRDPRDVVISYYSWLMKFRKTTKTFDEFALDFAHDYTWYGGWGNHVASWQQNASRVPNGFLLIRYEDLIADAVGKLSEVSHFLGLKASMNQIKETVRRNQLSRMKRKEKKACDTDLFRDTRDDIKFIRQGGGGQWREQLTENQLRLLVHSFGDIARQVGYELGEA